MTVVQAAWRLIPQETPIEPGSVHHRVSELGDKGHYAVRFQILKILKLSQQGERAHLPTEYWSRGNVFPLQEIILG